MGSVSSPLTGTPIFDSLGNASDYGPQQTSTITALEQYSIPRYPDAATGNTADPSPVAGKLRWINTAGTYGERLQYYSGATLGWLPLIPGMSWYAERTSTDDTSAGTFGNASALTITAAPPGRYKVEGKVACQPTANGLVYVRLRFATSNVGGDIPSSVGAGAYFTDTTFSETTLSAGGTNIAVSLQAQLSSGVLHLNAGSRVRAEWLGL